MRSGPQLTNSLLRRAGPPGRGDFCFGDFTHAPSPENLPKNGFCPRKGGAFLTEDVFEKKFLGAREDSAVGAGASTYGSAATGRGSERADGIGHSAASRPVTSPPCRFRTIQVCLRDLPARRW